MTNATVEVARAAVEGLERMIVALSLPGNTKDRVRTSLALLQEFPRLGQKLSGRWEGTRFVLGPWRWMILVYEFDEETNRVVILTIQDGRSSRAVTGK